LLDIAVVVRQRTVHCFEIGLGAIEFPHGCCRADLRGCHVFGQSLDLASFVFSLREFRFHPLEIAFEVADSGLCYCEIALQPGAVPSTG
jgi:hypothetical protein